MMSTRSASRSACQLCRSSLRFQSTTSISHAQHASLPSTPAASTSSHRIVASVLLSRPPLILPVLTPLESSYYSYQRSIARALAKPLTTASSWFLKAGSTSEKAFAAFDERVGKETGVEAEDGLYAQAREGLEDAAPLVPRETAADRAGDLGNLERRLERTLYLVVKKDRKDDAWQFPQGGVEKGESLVEAAQRELKEEMGADMDVWTCGTVPAGAYEYNFPSSYTKTQHSGAKVFFLPMRIVRGQPVPNKAEGLVEHAWLTREEVKEKVSPSYWDAVEPMLSVR